MWSGALTFDYRFSPALALTLQFDGHTAAFSDSHLPLLGSAWIMTLGGEYRWRSHWYLQLGVSEDIKVEASPDVNFVLGVGKGW
jgi:long-subunit fatty acid transport protein